MFATDEGDLIPTSGSHRGVNLHEQQTAARLAVVRTEIDHILDDVNDPVSLLNFAADAQFSPEARLCAAAKGRATLEQARDERQSIKGVTVEKFVGAAAGLDLLGWQSPTHFCSDLDDHDRAVKRRPEADASHCIEHDPQCRCIDIDDAAALASQRSMLPSITRSSAA